jgi:tRNA threonylcarbamoyladenosine biosynthesis protein TsaB
MIVLALESAASGCAACVFDGARVLASASEAMERGQDARLVPLVQEVMGQAGVAFSQIDRLAVTRGPGSFTGVRIGLATALGLSLALEKPVLGFDRFAIFRKAFAEERDLLVILESKRLELFCEIVPGHSQMLTPDAIEALIAQNPQAKMAGDAQAFFKGLNRTPLALPRPEVEIAALLAESADPADPAFAPRPLYLRSPDVTMPCEVP